MSNGAIDTLGISALVAARQELEQAKAALDEHRAHGFRETFEEMVLYDLAVARLTRSVMRLEKSYKNLLLKKMEEDDATEEGKEQEGDTLKHLGAGPFGEASQPSCGNSSFKGRKEKE